MPSAESFASPRRDSGEAAPARAPLQFGYCGSSARLASLPTPHALTYRATFVGVPNVSGGLVVSKIEQRTDWSPEYNVKLAQIAERVGFSHALTQIRFMGGYGAEYQHESASFSQHLLAHTTKLKLIIAILPGPWNPTLAAKQLASIDHYSNGRVAVNIVSGWFKGEFQAINEPWLDHGERYRRSEEFIKVLRGIWTAPESFTFHGNFYAYNSYPLRPQPVQKPGPEIFQGGNSADARGMAARVSDLLLLNGQKTIADFRELIDDTKERAVKEGRAGQVRLGVNAFVIVRDTEEEALAVWREIVGKADTEAVQGFLQQAKNAGASTSDKKGMWANSDVNDLVQYNDGFSELMDFSAPNYMTPNSRRLIHLCSESKLIGTARQVADRILLFRSLGIDFVLTAFLHFQEEIEAFGRDVMPLVRQGEAEGRGLDVEKEIAISGHIYQ
ncbi:BQ2448_3094 [Microbotryum intermedium]|uniref:BQ2448_3094 protein n=1 Tax=Microbotryum intermedium TaxID=269621 RepID=A0A238FKB1_9BASI|nr:BQ2448_3094 [Microbotryum intermedium]